MDNCLQIDIRLLRNGTVWCGVGLMTVPGIAEPLKFLACFDCKSVANATGGDMPKASALARLAARDATLASLEDALKGSDGKPANALMSQHVARSLADLRQGSDICTALQRHDPRAIIAVMELHNRAEHHGDPQAQKEYAMLRECMDLHDNGRATLRFSMPTATYSVSTSGRNPPSGRGAEHMVSGRNPPSGRGAEHMVSGRNPPSGRGAEHMVSGL